MNEKSSKGKIVINPELCKGCYLCIAVCMNQVIGTSGTLNQKGYYPAEFLGQSQDGKTCQACIQCGIICPDLAIEVFREE